MKRLLIRIDLLNARTSTWRPIVPLLALRTRSSSTRPYTFQYNEAHEQAALGLYRITAEQLQASVSRTDDFRRDGAVATRCPLTPSSLLPV